MIQGGDIPFRIEACTGVKREGHTINREALLHINDFDLAQINRISIRILGSLELIRSDKPDIKISVQEAFHHLSLVGSEHQLLWIVDIRHARILHRSKLHLTTAQPRDGSRRQNFAFEILNGLDIISIGESRNHTPKLFEIVGTSSNISPRYLRGQTSRSVLTFNARKGTWVDIDKVHVARGRVFKQTQKVERLELELHGWIKALSSCGGEIMSKGVVEFLVGRLESPNGQYSYGPYTLQIAGILRKIAHRFRAYSWKGLVHGGSETEESGAQQG
mmetsp:Transcript_6878/g.14019  ORF Transcript_6878/g.14019 Transcript_6878/m.14019 type:complete len:275 (+) Transcript_6878:2416-3240(+)